MKVTEALAEIRTIQKRLEKKRQFVADNLVREADRKDPFEKEGKTQEQMIAQERQAIQDLQARLVNLRLAINKANLETELSINGRTMSVAEWIVWRREVAPGEQNFLNSLRQGINMTRTQLRDRYQRRLVHQEATAEPKDWLVNVDEGKLAGEAEGFEQLLGDLDGQLSLLNATVDIELTGASV